MTMLDKLIHYLPVIIIVSPIVCTIILYQGNKLLYKHRWRAIHFMVQISAYIYLFAVIYMLERLVPFTITGYIVIVILVVLAILLIRQWKKNTEVVLSKALKMLSRILFLLCFVLYIVLVVVELVRLFS